MKLLTILFSLLILASCALNADQEQKLNQSLAGYLHARNECQLVSYVAFTYPGVVADYKEQGDSVFQAKFDCTKDSITWNDPTIRLIQQEGQSIHALIDVAQVDEYSYEILKDKEQLVAISEDSGNSWFFIEHAYYVDKSKLIKLKRLIKE
jgi:hypothetical protein